MSLTKNNVGILGFLRETPLCHNPSYRELLHLEGFQSWERAVIKCFSQIYHQNVVKSFMELQEEFALPRTTFFQYLQLRHALEAQARSSSLVLEKHALVKEVMQVRDRKGRISRVYSTLASGVHDPAKFPCRSKWEQDAGIIGGDTWDLCLQSIPLSSVSPSHKLSQLFILHRSYRTPLQLFHWGRRESPLYPKCKQQEGDLIHLLWRCPKLDTERGSQTRFLMY